MSSVFTNPWLGGLFSDDAAAAIWSPNRQLTYLLAFEAAFTRALGRTALVSTETADAAAEKIIHFQVDMDELRQGNKRDGLPIPALVSQLRSMAAENSFAIHSGATSQDVLDTALALTLRDFNTLRDSFRNIPVKCLTPRLLLAGLTGYYCNNECPLSTPLQ